MSKEQISQSYLEETKAKYLDNREQGWRQAIVVGSNKKDNIGAHIANKLRKSMKVDEFDKETWMSMIPPEYNILVLCNGSNNLDWIENQDIADIDEIINDCLITSIISTKFFVKATIDLKCPKYIIYIGSMAYRSVLNGSSPYCAAKAGLAHFAKCMAWELAPKNYNVYCIHPSNTEGTPMTEETIQGLMRYRNLTREQAEQYWGASLPRKNWLRPGEIANTVEYLVSGKADYMSGSQIELAGGQR